jgi:Tfp pilus assembly protein PilF
MSRIDNFERMLEQGQDGALLRFSLGNEYLGNDDPAMAVEHLRRAVEMDADYSAAWKALGKALEQHGEPQHAAEAWQAGIDAAERRGDKQAAKEMQVFLKRLDKAGRR